MTVQDFKPQQTVSAGLWHAPRPPCLWKQQPADFIVDELWQPPADTAVKVTDEHCLVLVEKEGQNTQWVARQLARWAGVP